MQIEFKCIFCGTHHVKQVSRILFGAKCICGKTTTLQGLKEQLDIETPLRLQLSNYAEMYIDMADKISKFALYRRERLPMYEVKARFIAAQMLLVVKTLNRVRDF